MSLPSLWEMVNGTIKDNEDLDALDRMSRASEWPVRLDVAVHANTSAKTLIYLSSDIHEIVRYGVQINPNTPPLVKMWLQGGYSDMTLQEFLEASRPGAEDV